MARAIDRVSIAKMKCPMCESHMFANREFSTE